MYYKNNSNLKLFIEHRMITITFFKSKLFKYITELSKPGTSALFQSMKIFF